MFEHYFSFVLLSDVKYSEMIDLPDEIYATDGKEVPIEKSRPGSCRNDSSPGRFGRDVDFLWYSPYRSFVINS